MVIDLVMLERKAQPRDDLLCLNRSMTPIGENNNEETRYN